MEELQRPVTGSYFEHLRALKESGNRRMENVLDMSATFDPNAPPPGPRPSAKSPRYGRRADLAAGGGGGGGAPSSSVTDSEVADFIEFTGASRDDAKEALRGAKARGLVMADAVSYYVEHRPDAPSRDAAGAAAGGAAVAAAPAPLRLAFDSDEDDVVAVPRDNGAALSGDLSGVYAFGGGAAIAHHAAAPVVIDETQPDTMQFMDVTGADRGTARRILAGAKRRGENVEAAINYYFVAATAGGGAVSGGGGGSDVDMDESSEDSAEESGSILSSAANAAMSLLSRLGVRSGEAAQVAAPTAPARVAVPAASATRERAQVVRVLPVPLWPAATPVEMRSYATQLLTHMTSHASDSQSKSNATYVEQLSSSCRDWRDHFGGATSATKKRNADAFVAAFGEALEARRPALSVPPAPRAVGRERRSRVMGATAAAGAAARAAAAAASATSAPPRESEEVQVLMSVTQQSARACRSALRDAGGDINVAMDRLTRD